MKLSVVTTITNPDERQDKWREALACYCAFADEVVVVNGGKPIISKTSKAVNGLMFYLESISPENESYVDKTKEVMLPWPHEWNWIELPRHLNAGLEACTGDWCLKIDADQFIHENDFDAVREMLLGCPDNIDVLTFQKMSMTYGGKYFQKGGQPIAFRRKDYIKIGKDVDKHTDLCFPIKVTGYEKVNDYQLPCGTELTREKTGISYWNYDYFFKDKRFTKREFWRFSKAYHRYFDEWTFGSNSDKSFRVFLNMMKGRHDKAPYTYKLEDHPKYIKEAVRNLKESQFGHSAWGEL